MFNIRFSQACAIGALSASIAFAPLAYAQSASTGASTPKQIHKAQRKQARANRTAEVQRLKSNGYKPGKDEANYPQDIQNAERKASQDGKPAAASAP
jgi:hypothetical protein